MSGLIEQIITDRGDGIRHSQQILVRLLIQTSGIILESDVTPVNRYDERIAKPFAQKPEIQILARGIVDVDQVYLLLAHESAIALHEAGHAKDFSRRENKGLNAAMYSLPGAALYYEAVATSDALTYLDDNCRYEDEKDAYQILHPAYGTYVGGLFLKESGLGFLMAIPGHVTGAFARLTVHDDKPCKSDNSEQHEEVIDKI